MKIKTIILTSFLLACFSSLSLATVYENAEEGHTNNWTIDDHKPKGAVIENVYDKELLSNVIKLQGEGRRNAYLIGSKRTDRGRGWNNKEEKTLKWKMNFSERFRISVYVQTKKGYRIFYYTPGTRGEGLYKKRYIRIALAKKTMDGTWQKISRDLEADLKKYEPNNKILTVNGLKIQGSGKIDDIELVSAMVMEDFPAKVLSDGNENPENGVYVKYTKDNQKAYIFVDQGSRYFDKHKGLTAVDISEREYPVITMYSSTVYSEPSDFYITENGNILVFTYTDNHQYMGAVNLNTLTFVDSVMLTISGMNSWANLYETNTTVNLFYTVHETPEKGRHTYYHISDSGDISKILGINSGALDSHFIWEQGAMGTNQYFITYLEEHAVGNTQYLKFIKNIYDVSNLPNMPLIDTIITEEEQPI